jgi:heme A synthase
MATIVHDRLANTALLFCLFMTVWGFWRFFRKNGMNSSYWGAAIIAEFLLLLQGGIGFYLWIAGLRPDRGWVHILYGISLVLAVPLVYTFTRGRQDRPEMLLYAVALIMWSCAPGDGYGRLSGRLSRE